MIKLNFTVDNVDIVLQVYNRIVVQRSDSESGAYSDVVGLGPIVLLPGVSSYTLTDNTGLSTSWYRSRYYSTITLAYSEWSSPVLGSADEIYYDPTYPEEVEYGTSEKLIIKRIRRLIGDPVSLRRECGESAEANVHEDNKTYELKEKGWPVSITIKNVTYTDTSNPRTNGYKFLSFNEDITGTTTVSGVEYSIDVWYYVFRHSDREIMEAYDNCPPPVGLTSATATPESYMLQTAIELVQQELWEDATEDGSKIHDERTVYDPSTGLEVRRRLIDNLKKRLDDLIKTLILGGISGVLID